MPVYPDHLAVFRLDQRREIAFPLLKGFAERHPELLAFKQFLADGGYDITPIYEQIENSGAPSLIVNSRRNESLVEGKDEDLRPLAKKAKVTGTTVIEATYNTIKYTQP